MSGIDYRPDTDPAADAWGWGYGPRTRDGADLRGLVITAIVEWCPVPRDPPLYAPLEEADAVALRRFQEPFL
jgi:hypothetical protein